MQFYFANLNIIWKLEPRPWGSSESKHRLADLRARLAEACRTGQQFDTLRYTRSLELGLAAAIEHCAAGLAPEDIVIPPAS
jgi:hypothetical protein